MKYEIFCGSRLTMEKTMERGVVGLNPKTHRWQIVDKAAKYEIIHLKKTLYALMSDKDLQGVARERGLIL